MKKFLAICMALFILIANSVGNIYRNSLENKVGPIDNSYFTKVNGKDIYIVKDNKWEKFEFIGVNLDSSKPGVFPNEDKISEEEYLRWIKYIYDMGANSIKIPNLMGENFYKALYKFNEDKENPIYLIQGIYFNETLLNNGQDPQGSELYKEFENNIKLVIDAVHGNPFNYDYPNILRSYNTDVSDYVLGYSLGIEFAKHDLIYTEIMNDKNIYNGKYMYTEKNASSFEAYMAKMGDYAASYEYDTYKEQKLISFIGSLPYDTDNSKEKINSDKISNTYDSKLDRYRKDYLDVENIKVKPTFKTGIFASYNMHSYFEEVKEYHGDIGEYLRKINDYHNIPVIISKFGIPSSRIPWDYSNNTEETYVNEKDQGEALVDIYREIKSSGLSGSFLFDFQDSWRAAAWNTQKDRVLDRSVYWSDAQTNSQGFGLMTFEPGKLEVVPYPDNSLEEWNEEDVINRNDNLSLSMKSDEKYLYFMLKSTNNFDLENEEIYIDLDVTPKSGVNKSSEYNLIFDNPVDFIMRINDNNESRVLVHEYYNSYNFHESRIKYEERPDLIEHTPHMDSFSTILMDIKPKINLEASGITQEKVTYETGKLIKGNGNPESEEFNSVSDYYIGENYVEIRIPWGMINFMDPSNREIQDDFYHNFKIKPLAINDIKVGVTLKKGNQTISRLDSISYKLDGWNYPKYKERLKESYYILKEELTKK